MNVRVVSVALLVAVAMISTCAVAAVHRSPPIETYLSGRWLVRPVRPDNWVQPYTHEAQFQPSPMFDGELSIAFQPFYGVDAATGVMASAAKRISETLGPPLYGIMGELLSLVAVATGTPTAVVTARMAAKEEPSTFAAWGECSAMGMEELTIVNSMIRNVSLNVKLNMESGVNGLLSLSAVHDGCRRLDSDGSHVVEGASAVQFPVSVHHAPTEFQKYRTISTTKDESRHVKSSSRCVRLPTPEANDSLGACKDVALPLELCSLSAHVLDDANILIHVVTKTGLTCGGEPSPHQTALCPVSFLFKRMSQSHEDRELWTTLGTLMLLVVVALVKFGPRWYMKWRGISPHAIGANTSGGGRFAPPAAAGNRSELLKHAEILRAAKKR